jgi:cytochrome oxidase Cu insertion factor (SCO1/SenC/PrrC family)
MTISLPRLALTATVFGLYATVTAAVPTGPALGATVPPFRAIDQHGKERTLQSLTGRKGLMLVFFRSADW